MLDRRRRDQAEAVGLGPLRPPYSPPVFALGIDLKSGQTVPGEHGAGCLPFPPGDGLGREEQAEPVDAPVAVPPTENLNPGGAQRGNGVR